MHSTHRPLAGTAAVVGAGGLGLAAIKNLLAAGFDVTGYDLADEVGGNWYIDGPTSRVYQSTHTISTKPFTQYPDFPMPDEWPDYPHHSQMGEYLRRYADHFGLRRRVRLQTEVVGVEAVDPDDPGTAWDVTARGPDGSSTTERVDVVVVANGHNWQPKMPDIPGQFDGQVMHSAQYKSADVLRGRRVLVVGAGNTGCDIAVEAAQQARSTLHSTRRGYWYAPKYAFGKPSDQVNDLITGLRTPMWLKQRLMHATIRLTVGAHHKLGLPAPDHAILETHPIANSLLPYYVGQGDIRCVPDLARFVRDDRPSLALNMVPATYDTLAVMGLYQPDSGVFAIAHWQGVLVAELFSAAMTSPGQSRRIRQRVLEPLRGSTSTSRTLSGGVRFASSTRHYFEVSHQEYLRALDRTIQRVRRARMEAA
jgi:thioredoxin reductase